MMQPRSFLIAIWLFVSGFLIPSKTLFAFEKLPEAYTLSLGNVDAKTKVVEYFSLSCPLCLKLLKEEFLKIYEEQIASSKVYWVFHPDPQDMMTLQLMICLEKLPQDKKWTFFWELVSAVKPNCPEKNTFLIQQLIKQFGIALPHLHKTSWIEGTTAYKSAFEYIKQKDAPDTLPALEINGNLYEDLPTQKLLKEVLK